MGEQGLLSFIILMRCTDVCFVEPGHVPDKVFSKAYWLFSHWIWISHICCCFESAQPFLLVQRRGWPHEAARNLEESLSYDPFLPCSLKMPSSYHKTAFTAAATLVVMAVS